MAQSGLEGSLAPQTHVCALIEQGDEPATLFAPFLREGLVQGERVVAIAGPQALDKHRRELEMLQTDTGRCEAAGHLQLLSWRQVQGSSAAAFDACSILDTLNDLLGGAMVEGAPATRLLAEMDWVVSLTGGSEAVAQYERGLDRLVHDSGQIAVCVYDLSRLSGQLLMELLASHALTWTQGQLVPSPFYASGP
jgi:hypothetical protein